MNFCNDDTPNITIVMIYNRHFPPDGALMGLQNVNIGMQELLSDY